MGKSISDYGYEPIPPLEYGYTPQMTKYGVGDKIPVIWGKFGLVTAVIDRIASSGVIYAKRYNARRKRYTVARKVELRRGGYHIV